VAFLSGEADSRRIAVIRARSGARAKMRQRSEHWMIGLPYLSVLAPQKIR
jgi:hypothetical protein